MKSLERCSRMFIFLLLISLLITGCKNTEPLNDSSKTTAIKKEPLTFRITWKAYSGRGEAIQKIVDLYNAQNHDGYEVRIVDGDEDFTSVKKLIETDHSVDIYVLPYRLVQYFGNRKDLLSLTNSFSQERKYFYEALWKLGVVDQEVYGIPWLGHSMCLIYNKNLLDKAGVDPDSITNLNNLVLVLEKVEKNTDAKGIGLVGAAHNDVSWMINQFIYGFGSGLVSKDGASVSINNDRSKAAINFYKNVLGKYAQATWTKDTGVEVMDYFRNQKVAFEFQGPWGITDIWKNGNDFDVGVISLNKIGLYSEVGPLMLSLPSQIDEKKKKAAIAFIHFMISKEAQETIMDGEYSPEHDAYYPFRVPVRKDLTKSLVFVKYPDFLPFIEGFSEPSIDVPIPEWQIIKDTYYAPGLHQVMQGQISIDAFLKNIEKEGNKILQERKD